MSPFQQQKRTRTKSSYHAIQFNAFRLNPRCLPILLVLAFFICISLTYASTSEDIASKLKSNFNNPNPNQKLELHKKLSPAELMQIFHVDNHEQVPLYQIVNIKALNKKKRRRRRSIGPSPTTTSNKNEDSSNNKSADKQIVQDSKLVMFEAFGKELRLNLKPNMNLMKGGSNIRMFIADGKKKERKEQEHTGSYTSASRNSDYESEKFVQDNDHYGKDSVERVAPTLGDGGNGAAATAAAPQAVNAEVESSSAALTHASPSSLHGIPSKTGSNKPQDGNNESYYEYYYSRNNKEGNRRGAIKTSDNNNYDEMTKEIEYKEITMNKDEVKSSTLDDDLEELAGSSEEIGYPYQDEKNQAALLIHRDADGSLLMDGIVGSSLVVKPVPAKLKKLLQIDETSTSTSALPVSNRTDDMDAAFLDEEEGEDYAAKGNFNSANNTFTYLPMEKKMKRKKVPSAHTGMHIVYETKHVDSHSDFAFMEPPEHANETRSRNKRDVHGHRVKRDAPYVIYPEILVIVDYDGYRLHGGDNLQVKRYFVSFWNGVDLRYKVLKGPKIRISIAGIIISRGRDATPYLERNRVGRDALDSAQALTDLGKYLFQERRLPVYDIAVVVTKLDMCRRQFANDVCNRGTAGFAYVGGACVVNKRLEKVNSVAIVEDTGGFSGIIVAAHEVGHLLGCVHDGSPAPSYLGGPGAQKCRWEDGYIMSDLRHTERGFQWSACSIAQFHHFLNGDTATCLYNSPHEDGSLPRVLPGKLLSLDAQCRKDRGTSACFKDDRVCAQLFCFDATSGYCVAYRPAAEGSPCGDGHQHCVSGRCVVEHENIIPDYSQITPQVVTQDGVAISTSSFSFPTRNQESSTQPYKGNNNNVLFVGFNANKDLLSSTTQTTTKWITTSKYPFRTTSTTTKKITGTTSSPNHRFVWNKSTYNEEREGGRSVKPLRAEVEEQCLINPHYGSTRNKDNLQLYDRITRIYGMTCFEFISSDPTKYCFHPYILSNCLCSQRVICKHFN